MPDVAVFADTVYWIAVANPRDQWHRAALDARERLGDAPIVTTEEVLTEVLNALSKSGTFLREKASEMVDRIRADPNVIVVPQSADTFLRGLRLFKRRQDKGYSLTDCISMNTMRDKEIGSVLTNERDFAQEGFIVLIHGDA